MCTVTFLPLSDTDFVLTSSRDVGYRRERALEPSTYLENNVSLHYPKDGKAGGTWIGTSRNSRLICLLNGGFSDHDQMPEYEKSRGIVVKELLIAEDFQRACNKIELKHIEPFTLVVVEWINKPKLLQFVWDGEKKHSADLEWSAKIWSSSTLYTDEVKARRQHWFRTWCKMHNENAESALGFHLKAGTGDPENDVFMRRSEVGTVSITQVLKTGDTNAMDYFPYPLDQKGNK